MNEQMEGIESSNKNPLSCEERDAFEQSNKRLNRKLNLANEVVIVEALVDPDRPNGTS